MQTNTVTSPSLQARVDAIVGQIAYAQVHGARAVLDEAIQNGEHLPPAVVTALVEARQACANAEKVTKALGTTAQAVERLRNRSASRKESDRRLDERICAEAASYGE